MEVIDKNIHREIASEARSHDTHPVLKHHSLASNRINYSLEPLQSGNVGDGESAFSEPHHTIAAS
jgi:hypothetical protein